MKRRTFLKSAMVSSMFATGGGMATGFAAETANPDRPNWKKALKYSMFPRDLTDEEKFKLAARCGYDGVDLDQTITSDLDAARRQADLARKCGCPIHGLVRGGWHAPLSDPDPKVIDQGLKDMEIALRHAKAIDVDTVLLVPAIVTEQVGYAEAYDRSHANVAKLVPLAEELGVAIAIENVWNKFLLSPLEFARYIDEFQSPMVRAYFDLGNVILFGFSQHWIRTLNKRIIKLDVKDFKRQGYQWKNLLEGDVNWKEARKALLEIKYEGFITAEVAGGDEAYLTDLADRMERIIVGKF